MPTNRLQRAAERLADRLLDQASVTVTYRRGASSVSLAAVLGHQLLRVSDGRGNTKVERTDRDFIIRAADLVIGGSVVEPRRGDRIDLTTGSTTERFDVMAPGDEPPWRYADPHKQLIRVHTKHVGSV